jgi:hypothetical protein
VQERSYPTAFFAFGIQMFAGQEPEERCNPVLTSWWKMPLCSGGASRSRTGLALMLAMILQQPGQPLRPADIPVPKPGAGQVLIQVHACAVCRTDLHIVDGELTDPKLPPIPGHEIVGTVVDNGAGANRFVPGDRVGVPWLGWTCGECRFCRSGFLEIAPRVPVCEPLFGGLGFRRRMRPCAVAPRKARGRRVLVPTT